MDSSVNILPELEKVYKVLYRILLLPESDWKTKIYANAAMSYFINPHDIIPEAEKGNEGYVDDFYVCLIILKELHKYRDKLVKKLSSEYILEDLDKFLQKNIITCENILKEKTENIKKLIGFETLKKFDIGNKFLDEKLSQQLQQHSKVLGAIAYFYFHLLKRDKEYFEAYLSELRESENFFDVKRIIHQFETSGISSTTIDKIKDIKDIFVNYETELENISEKLEYHPITKFAKPLFNTLCSILKDKECDWFTRHEINSVLSYFAIVDDVIDDSLESGLGFVDDVFLAAFTLWDISERDKGIVERNLNGLNLNETYQVLEESSSVVETEIGHIINLLGLRGLLTFHDMKKQNIDYKKGIFLTVENAKRILLDLATVYFSKKVTMYRGKQSVDQIIENIMENLPEDMDVLFSKFIEIAVNVSYNKNIQKELDEGEDQELKLLILKHKILSS